MLHTALDALRAAEAMARAGGRRLRHGPERTTWSALDEAVLSALRGAFGGAGDRPYPVIRRQFDRIAALETARRRVHHRTAVVGGVPAARVWPRARRGPSDGLVLLLHGGGYVFGSTRSHRILMADLACATGLDVLGLDYRLAPEHPCPAALDDVLAAWRALVAAGTDPARTVWVGDSAGGGLVVLGLREAVARGLPVPAGGALLSPWVDLTCTSRSHVDNAAADYVASPGRILDFARDAAGTLPLDHPLVSPLLHPLPALPPLLVQVGSAEILLDDALALAAHARASGTDVDLQVWEDRVHVWHALSPVLPSARAAIAQLAGWTHNRLR